MPKVSTIKSAKSIKGSKGVRSNVIRGSRGVSGSKGFGSSVVRGSVLWKPKTIKSKSIKSRILGGKWF